MWNMIVMITDRRKAILRELYRENDNFEYLLCSSPPDDCKTIVLNIGVGIGPKRFCINHVINELGSRDHHESRKDWIQ